MPGRRTRALSRLRGLLCSSLTRLNNLSKIRAVDGWVERDERRPRHIADSRRHTVILSGRGEVRSGTKRITPSPPLFLPFNPPLVWLNSARGTGKRFFYLISLPLLGEGTGAICLLLLSLSLLLTFFFFFFFFVSLFEQVWQKKELGELEMENDFLPGSVVLDGRIDLSSSSSSWFLLLLIFLYVFRIAFWERKLREWKWFSSWFLLRFWVEESMWFVFFLSFFINYGSALTWSLVTVRYEAAHSRLAKKRFI